MTITASAADTTVVPQEVLDRVRTLAADLDQDRVAARELFPDFAIAGLLDLGAANNHDGMLPAMTSVIEQTAAECVSTAFSLWANRMTIEYLRAAGTAPADALAEGLLDGSHLGITGMAAAFKQAAGCGTIELTATATAGGYLISGPIRWASNLYPDSILVSAARTETGDCFVFAIPLATAGVEAGRPFSLLALDSTHSAGITLQDVLVPHSAVLSTDLDDFLGRVRPTFLVLQSALCVGLARTSLVNARASLVGVNAVYAYEADQLLARLSLLETSLPAAARAIGSDQPPSRRHLLSLRLAAAEVATGSAALEVRTAGGQGYASRTPTSRRFRESMFIPVQSPSEAQLRWELANLD